MYNFIVFLAFCMKFCIDKRHMIALYQDVLYSHFFHCCMCNSKACLMYFPREILLYFLFIVIVHTLFNSNDSFSHIFLYLSKYGEWQYQINVLKSLCVHILQKKKEGRSWREQLFYFFLYFFKVSKVNEISYCGTDDEVRI